MYLKVTTGPLSDESTRGQPGCKEIRNRGQPMTAVTETPAAPAEGAAPPAPDQAMDAAKQWAQDYMAKLTEATTKRLAEIAGHSNGANGGIAPRIGEPTVGQYVAFDVAATSPIQFTALPPYQPSKVIAAEIGRAHV